MSKSDYIYKIHQVDKVIEIEDLNLGKMSVTNNIENVVDEIAKKEEINRDDFKVIYRDSVGNWDGYNTKTKEFISLDTDMRIVALTKTQSML
ncbi:hypothetical protein [Flavobacterium sp. 25HG05S-40]|uniref:hypothetical protein n=1 Tax=Flavobacterium sp. 25HG05S-40 TaxID=3458682 RepID=UPI004044DE27